MILESSSSKYRKGEIVFNTLHDWAMKYMYFQLKDENPNKETVSSVPLKVKLVTVIYIKEFHPDCVM